MRPLSLRYATSSKSTKMGITILSSILFSKDLDTESTPRLPADGYQNHEKFPEYECEQNSFWGYYVRRS